MDNDIPTNPRDTLTAAVVELRQPTLLRSVAAVESRQAYAASFTAIVATEPRTRYNYCELATPLRDRKFPVTKPPRSIVARLPC